MAGIGDDIYLRVGDARRDVRALLGRLEVRSWASGARALACVTVALALAYLPAHPGLDPAARHAMFILLVAAGLWITEAIPAFAVALVVMALAIVLLGDMGRPGGALGWERFVAPWASPMVWLFLGGFVLGRAASRTGLDRSVAMRALALFGPSPSGALLGLMGVAYVLSMFMSNTAATAMLLAVVAPILASVPPGDPLRKALALGVPVAANLGGMATLIGSPPNAIAVGALGESTIDFARWMLIGLPPSLALLVAAWLFLRWRYRSGVAAVTLASVEASIDAAGEPPERLSAWRRIIVVATLALTVGLWFTSSLHGIPTPVVSFLPITVFAAVGVMTPLDIRALGWDILLLLAGGLVLGVVVSTTGLAEWAVGHIPLGGLGPVSVALAAAFATVLLSNLMSNTAAANILVPVAIALTPHARPLSAATVALAASCAMALPISTPPNAIAYATRELDARDFLAVGVGVGVVGPLLVVGWASLVAP
ncbi:MAG: DASS family sodium-coupled anion symporter [Polyangiales bacterium]